jgi:protein-disulfide isomerase
MRWLFALSALLLVAAAKPQASSVPATGRDWSAVATRLPSGAYLIGNPRARVKLVEYASYTCSHCAEFANDSAPVLKDRLIRSGTTSLEFRHVVFNALDLGAAVLARCTGPSFAVTTARFYQTQPQWLARGAQFGQANAQRLAMYPISGRLRALVDGAGLTAMTALKPAAIDACFADTKEIDRIATMAGEVSSTPTFFLGGRRLAGHHWPEIETQLRAAGAR